MGFPDIVGLQNSVQIPKPLSLKLLTLNYNILFKNYLLSQKMTEVKEVEVVDKVEEIE